MAKRQSALAANYHRGLHGRPGEPGVRLQEVPDLNLYQMSAWPETLGAVGMTVRKQSAVRRLRDRARSSAGKRETPFG